MDSISPPDVLRSGGVCVGSERGITDDGLSCAHDRFDRLTIGTTTASRLSILTRLNLPPPLRSHSPSALSLDKWRISSRSWIPNTTLLTANNAGLLSLPNLLLSGSSTLKDFHLCFRDGNIPTTIYAIPGNCNDLCLDCIEQCDRRWNTRCHWRSHIHSPCNRQWGILCRGTSTLSFTSTFATTQSTTSLLAVSGTSAFTGTATFATTTVAPSTVTNANILSTLFAALANFLGFTSTDATTTHATTTNLAVTGVASTTSLTVYTKCNGCGNPWVSALPHLHKNFLSAPAIYIESVLGCERHFHVPAQSCRAWRSPNWYRFYISTK